MVNIKYTLCAEGQIYGAGESNLKESLGRPLDSNGCTVFLCTAGRAVVFINFQKCVLKRGDVVFLFSDIVFAADKVSNLFSVLYISLPDEAVEETLYKLTSISFWDFIYGNPICRTSEKQYALLYGWCQQTRWILEDCMPENRQVLLSNNVYNLFTAVDSELKRESVYLNNKSKRDRGWTLSGKFATLLAEYCHVNRDVKFYADKLCITPDYLYKLTQKTMGMSPKEVIDQQIIVEIKTYLLNTDLSVKNIASELNFEDPSYMCRFFRRMTGVSPISYRNPGAHSEIL